MCIRDLDQIQHPIICKSNRLHCERAQWSFGCLVIAPAEPELSERYILVTIFYLSHLPCLYCKSLQPDFFLILVKTGQ